MVTRLGDGVDATGVLGDEAMAARARDARPSTAESIDAQRRRAGRRRAHERRARRRQRRRRSLARVRDALRARRARHRRRRGGAADLPRRDERARARRRDARRSSSTSAAARPSSSSARAARSSFHVSTQVGVVRHTERHLAQRPADAATSCDALAADVARDLRGGGAGRGPPDGRARHRRGGHGDVAGRDRPGSGAVRPERVHGHVVSLAALSADPRAPGRAARGAAPRRSRGLHPDRAPTIVAGVVMVIEALELFGLDAIEVSDHDILRGAALEVVHRPAERRGDRRHEPDRRAETQLDASHGARRIALATCVALAHHHFCWPPGRMFDGARWSDDGQSHALAKGCSCRHGVRSGCSAS